MVCWYILGRVSVVHQFWVIVTYLIDTVQWNLIDPDTPVGLDVSFQDYQIRLLHDNEVSGFQRVLTVYQICFSQCIILHFSVCTQLIFIRYQ